MKSDKSSLMELGEQFEAKHLYLLSESAVKDSSSLHEMGAQQFPNLQESNSIFPFEDGFQLLITEDFPLVLRILQPKVSIIHTISQIMVKQILLNMKLQLHYDIQSIIK